jgi:hypothetical protein
MLFWYLKTLLILIVKGGFNSFVHCRVRVVVFSAIFNNISIVPTNQTNLNAKESKDGDEAAYVVVFILVYHLLVEANDILFSVPYFT